MHDPHLGSSKVPFSCLFTIFGTMGKAPFFISLGLGLCLVVACTGAFAQRNPADYIATEAQVPSYTLPPLFPAGFATLPLAAQKQAWETLERPRIIALFERHIYGRAPSYQNGNGWRITYKTIEQGSTALYRRRQVLMTIANPADDTLNARLMVLLPLSGKLKGLAIGLNFYGNHTTTLDPAILLSPSHCDPNPNFLTAGDRQSQASGGVRQGRWPIHLLLQQGFGLITAAYEDFEPDIANLPSSFKPYGLRLLFAKALSADSVPSFGAIGAWAFGLQRMLDYASQDPELQLAPAYAIGHSRLGKAALWAAAQDTRFAGVLANGSGRFGASLSRRQFGEPLATICQSFPHWFVPSLPAQSLATLPVDQHQLIALVAPRKVMIASATKDWWADPKGEFLSLRNAAPAWALYGQSALSSTTPWPAPLNPARSPAQLYHLRPGDHDITYLEWQTFLSWLGK